MSSDSPKTGTPTSEDIGQEGTDVFISYSRTDRDFVRWLNRRFQEAGKDPWIDWAGLQPSEEWWPAILRGIDSADTFLFVLSPDSATSEICRKEIDRAASSGKRIVPVVCRKIEAVEIHPELAKRNYVMLRSEHERKENLGQVFRALDTHLEHVRAHTRFLIRAREWEASGRQSHSLLRGADLALAEQWLDSWQDHEKPDPIQLHWDHLRTSKDHDQAERDKLRRIIGRAFVKPALQVQESGSDDQVLRLAAAGAVLANDIDLNLVPELWGPAALAIFRNRTTAVFPGTAAGTSRDGRYIFTVLNEEGTIWDARNRSRISRLQSFEKPVENAVFSRDGSKMLAFFYRWIWVWDVDSGALVHCLEGHEDGRLIQRVDFSPDGRLIASTSGDKTARIWDVHGGIEIARFDGLDGGKPCALFSPDCQRILIGPKQGVMLVIDIHSGSEMARLEVSGVGSVRDVAAFSPDGSLIATSTSDSPANSFNSDSYTARVWNAENGNEISCFKEHRGLVNSLVFDRDGSRVLTASSDKTARLWSCQDGTELVSMNGHIGDVRHAAFCSNGSRVVTASDDGTARIWDASSGDESAVLLGHHHRGVRNATFGPDDQRIFTVGYDGARVWDARRSFEIARFDVSTNTIIGSRKHAAFSPQGRWIATFSDGEEIRIWDGQNGSEKGRLPSQEDIFTNVSFSPDEASVVTTSRDGFVRIWDIQSGTEILSLHRHENWVSNAIFSPNGKSVVSSSGDLGFVWDTESGVGICQFAGAYDHIYRIWFSPHGRFIVGALVNNDDYGTVQVWSSEDGSEIAQFRRHRTLVIDATICPKGRKVVTTERKGRGAWVWDIESGDEIFELSPEETFSHRFESVQFSPDGRHILTSGGSTLRIWDADSGIELAHVDVGTDVSGAEYSPDGLLIIAMTAMLARFFDTQRLAEIGRLEGHAHRIKSTQFNPSDSRLVLTTSMYDGTARLWDVSKVPSLRDPALSLTAALSHGVGLCTESESADLLMQEAPPDLYSAAAEQVQAADPQKASLVEGTAADLRAPVHPNCYLSPTRYAEKFGFTLGPASESLKQG